MEKLYADMEGCQGWFRKGKKQEWGYISESEMLKRYPDGGFRVCGDLSDRKAETPWKKLVWENQEADVLPYQGAVHKGQYIIGYIPLTEKDSFIRIVGKRKSRILGALILAALILTIFFGGMWLGQRNRPVDAPVKIKAGEMVNPNPANIRLPGIDKVYAEADSTRVEQLLLNVEGNAYDLQYTITLDDTGEELYQSGLIEPGYGVKAFDMTRTFQEGEYPITIMVTSSAQEDKKDENTERVAYNAGKLKATLVVQ
ncbi:MAG TPA: hypothetical protein H9858_07095 [Candidatus Blautia stercoravium]|nr:hypothetical protein [Candidatus Blautia stercoravium]